MVAAAHLDDRRVKWTASLRQAVPPMVVTPTTTDTTETTMTAALPRCLAALVLTATLAASTGSASAHGGHADHDTTATLTTEESRVIKKATKHLRHVDAALAAGYVPASPCIALPGVGAMGYHYVHPALAADEVIDPTRPEMLLYEPGEAGKLRLVGVEYFKADADQDLGTDADRPSLFGHELEGPMPGHDPGMPVHFDLHVWLYETNPAGQLAVWNPRVSCP